MCRELFEYSLIILLISARSLVIAPVSFLKSVIYVFSSVNLFRSLSKLFCYFLSPFFQFPMSVFCFSVCQFWELRLFSQDFSNVSFWCYKFPSQHMQCGIQFLVVVQSLSHVRLFATPWTVCSLPGTSVHGGFFKQEYWSGLPCPPPGGLPNPGIVPRSPSLQADSLPSEPPGKPE